MLLLELQLQAFVSGYIVPHEGGRGRLQAARAWPEYFGRRCYSDISVAGANDARWYARALLFFRAGKHDSKWDERAHKRVPTVEWIDLVFVRWYKKTGYRDAVTCDIYEWEKMPGRSESPRLSVEPLRFHYLSTAIASKDNRHPRQGDVLFEQVLQVDLATITVQSTV